jgi:exopolyphosphatase / guanosine-5'-triphosphate,3'-diphosphate pyrophosphatase
LWGRHHDGVPVGVVDVGSNTVRVQVAEGGRTIYSERELLHLGADVEVHGSIPEAKLESTAEVVARFVAGAHAAGAETVEVLIASPGRQAANGDELADVIAARSGSQTRILSSIEEGQLAFLGALSCAGLPAGRLVAVVDVGGGSAQVVVGSSKQGPVWWRSIDLGSQRLTSRLLSEDPPGPDAVGAARAEVERYLEDFAPRQPRTALAVGGSARALKRIAGGRLGPGELDDVIARLATTPAETLAERHGVSQERARTLPAGAIILAGIQRRLGTPLRVQRGGLREGALLALAAQRELAA